MWNFLYYLRRQIHGSYLIMWASIGAVLGIAAAKGHPLVDVKSYLVLGFCLLLVSFWKRKIWMTSIVLVAGVVIGVARGGVVSAQYAEYAPYFARQVILQGRVSEDVVLGGGSTRQLVLHYPTINNKLMVGEVWLSAHTYKDIRRSDDVTVRGVLKPGFGAYAASMTYATVTAHQARPDIARDTRDAFAHNVRKVVSEPMASLGLGFLVGQRSQLPPELDEQLRVAGLTHIVVASGYNVTILLRLAKRFFEKISKYLTALSGILLLGAFLLVTGFTPSMVRAAIVGGLSLAAWYYGRSFYPFVLIAIVMCLTALWNPAYVWGDAGWYLSFAAFFGVMVLAPLTQRYFFGEAKPNFLRQIVGETIAALLMTLPITLLLFQHYSTYALLANILIVPFVPLAMLAVFIAGVLSWLFPWLVIGGIASEVIIGAMVGIVQWVAALPQADGELEVPFLTIVVYYFILSSAIIYMWLKTRYSFRESNIIE